MNLTLQLADSEVIAVSVTDGDLQVELAAAHVLRGQGEDPGSAELGFSLNVLLAFNGVGDVTEPQQYFGRVASGRLHLSGSWSRSVPLPCSVAGPVRVELNFANQRHLEFSAAAFHCSFAGEANFAESLFC